MPAPVFAANDRLLVWAPHPDDETLACGGLIQRTLAAGGMLRIVFASDGDADPWPQRWSERRWRLDAADAARWGALRRGETMRALRQLGVDADAAHWLHWPDQGLSTLLHAQPATTLATIRALLREHAPTRIAIPCRHDSHPDHSASALLLSLALRAEASAAEVWCYQVHGPRHRHAAVVALDLDHGERARKHAAALAYASQLHFGERRLLRFVTAQEHYGLPSRHEPDAQAVPWRWRFGMPRWRSLCLPTRLRVLGVDGEGGLLQAAFDLPRWPWPRPAQAGDARTTAVRMRRGRDRLLHIELTPLWPQAQAVFAKIDSAASPWLAYDAEGWAGLDAPTA